MYQGYRVVAVTGFGRRRYTDILVRYTQKLRGLIDEHQLWRNTENQVDIETLQSYIRQAPHFFREVVAAAPFDGSFLGNRLAEFYRDFQDDNDTIYIRFDDDIVWLADNAVQQLLDFRIQNPNYFLIYANTINNSLCSHLHQRIGALPSTPFLEYQCMGPTSWRRWETAAACHQALTEAIEAGDTARFLFSEWRLLEYERCSINCIAWWGRDNALIRQHMTHDEEYSLSCGIPRQCGRTNCIAGEALVAHFAYHPQRDTLEKQADWLTPYRNLSPSQT